MLPVLLVLGLFRGLHFEWDLWVAPTIFLDSAQVQPDEWTTVPAFRAIYMTGDQVG